MVGGSHRELLIAGPAATATIMAEKVAERRADRHHTGHCGRTTQKSHRQERRNRLPTRRARRRPRGWTSMVAQPNPRVDAVRPLTLREPLLAGHVEPEHRPAVVTFISFTDFDRRDPRRWARGGGAGAGPTGEDGADRSRPALGQHFSHRTRRRRRKDHPHLRASLRPLDSMPRRCCSPPMRSLGRRSICRCTSGSTGGLCSPARSGPGYRRTYTVMGDTVNLAGQIDGAGGTGRGPGHHVTSLVSPAPCS